MNPMLALQLGSMAISGISSFFGQKAENKQASAQMEAAFRAANWDMRALEDRALQQEQAVGLEMFERQRQALRERAKILTAAGEAGVSGSSVLRQINQSMLDESYDIGIQQTNLENALSQTNLQAQNVVSTAYSRANQAAAGVKNPWIAPLTIGAGAAASYKLSTMGG
jgi:hypothetical protein